MNKLSGWEYIGGHRRVYVRGDQNRTVYAEVARDPEPRMHNNYKWELLKHPLGGVVESGWNLYPQDAKANATRALNKYLQTH